MRPALSLAHPGPGFGQPPILWRQVDEACLKFGAPRPWVWATTDRWGSRQATAFAVLRWGKPYSLGPGGGWIDNDRPPLTPVHGDLSIGGVDRARAPATPHRYRGTGSIRIRALVRGRFSRLVPRAGVRLSGVCPSWVGRLLAAPHGHWGYSPLRRSGGSRRLRRDPRAASLDGVHRGQGHGPLSHGWEAIPTLEGPSPPIQRWGCCCLAAGQY